MPVGTLARAYSGTQGFDLGWDSAGLQPELRSKVESDDHAQIATITPANAFLGMKEPTA